MNKSEKKMTYTSKVSSREKQTMTTLSEIDPVVEQELKKETQMAISSTNAMKSTTGMRIGSLLKTWTEVTRLNYMSSQLLAVIKSGQSIRRRSIGLPVQDYTIQNLVPTELRNKSEEELFAQQFPINVTPLMNEDQLWGCFYNFPELYSDAYSPVVRIRKLEDVSEIVGGVLTRDMVTASLTYLKRTPILGDFVYIKLDLSSKHLQNIEVLQHYKYLVYLDLSSNYLNELNVLKHLLYLQFLSVAFNRLNTVLEYETPQWFLSEVNYKFNSVKKIRDLSAFWSLTTLDLSHNNIKSISGLESLRYLRRLDLSFNHIQKLENLDHLRLLWLDVSYNNISSFDFGPQTGLWTLLHLEYLNLNENKLTSMKMFSGCTRLRELHARNNRLNILLELAVYMRQMRRLIILDLRSNPLCETPGYKDVVINTFPILLSLDAEELDPIEQRSLKMAMSPDINTYASRRLLRLLYIEQLSRSHVSFNVPPADTTEVPIVVLVGYEAVGKGNLARRLASECSSNIELALQHTTACYHTPGYYKEVTRSKFDDMLMNGEFLTYSEMEGESYGLSRQEAFIKDGKVKITTMDLVGALMLKLRGRRPYLILATCLDKTSSARKRQQRKTARNQSREKRLSLETPLERSTLQVLLSGRIIITGILNEILVSLPEEKEQSEFLLESECSLFMDSDARVTAARDYIRGINLINIITSSSSSMEEASKQGHDKSNQLRTSLYSLYKESQATGEYISDAAGQNSYHEQSNAKKCDNRQSQSKSEKLSSYSQPKSVDFSHYTSTTWKGTKAPRSISTKLPWPCTSHGRRGSVGSNEDQDLWLAFLMDTGLLQASELLYEYSDIQPRTENKIIDDPNSIMRQLDYPHKEPYETYTTNIRDDYEGIHRKWPGLFWDTVTMDDPEEAFLKMKNIIKDIVNSQKTLRPMFDIDFVNLKHYPTVQKKLLNIRNQIAPQRLFY